MIRSLALLLLLLPSHAWGQSTVFAQKGDVAAAAYALALTERVDVAVIGDSNAFWGAISNGGYGHFKGLAFAAAQKYGLYKSPTLPMNINGGSWNSGSWTATSEENGLIPGGNFVRYADFSNNDTNETAPSELHQYAVAPRQGDGATNPGGGMPWGYYYFADAGAMSAPNLHRGPHWWKPSDATRVGLLDIDANLTYHLRYGTFETGTGQFSCQCMDWASSMPNASGTSHAASATINPVTGSYGLADLELSIPAGSRGSDGIVIKPVQVNATTGPGTRVDLAGPFFGLWQCLENEDQTTGIGVNIAGHFGGLTAYDAANYYLGTDGSTAAGYSVRTAQQEFWRFTMSTQRASMSDAKLIVHILFAQNDIDGDSSASSLGPNPASSDTKEGFADNHVAIITQLRADYSAIGLNLNNVWFICGPYARNPAQSTATRLEWFTELDDTFATDDRVIVMYGDLLMTEAEIESNGDFDPLTAHLEPQSYRVYQTNSLSAIGGATSSVRTQLNRAANILHITPRENDRRTVDLIRQGVLNR